MHDWGHKVIPVGTEVSGRDLDQSSQRLRRRLPLCSHTVGHQENPTEKKAHAIRSQYVLIQAAWYAG
jgi:hypothetical protein